MPAIVPFIPLLAAGVSAGAGLYAGNKASKQNAQIQQGMAQTQGQQMDLFRQAQGLFPGMQQISNQYGQGAQGFLGDRGALGQLQGQYAPLMEQMSRLYGQDVLGGEKGALTQLQALYNNGGATDGGAGAALRENAQGVLGATSSDVYRNQARLAGEDAMGQLTSQLASRGIASSGTSSRLGAATLSRLYADAAARGQQDRLNAYGISNSALGQAGQMSLAQGQQQASLLGQIGQLGLAGQQQRAGLLGQQAGMLGQQQQGILAQSGLLGQFLQALQGQYGMQQGLAGMYNQQAGVLGGMWQQQASQVNPNPYGGLMAGIGAVGPAAAQYMDWRAKGVAGGPYSSTMPMPGFGVANNPYSTTTLPPIGISGGRYLTPERLGPY